jgi:prolyl-tRNA editing enzyme YbaK/EbsC (Cys-tRNA(Pro) deacylase)
MRLSVEDFLVEAGVEYRLIELKKRAITVNDVVEYSSKPVNPEEICKTILVKQGKQYYALFLRGSDRVDFRKLKKLIGKAQIASLEEVRAVVGVDPGAVCPLLLDVPVIVDRRLLELERLNFGSGHHLYGIEIDSSDLGRVLEYTVANFAE